MSRQLSAAFKTAIQQRNINTTFLLIDIAFSTPVYYTTLSKQITWSGHTYTPSSGVISVESPRESVDFNVGTIYLLMSGSNQSNITLALSEAYLDKELIVRRAVMDSSYQIIATPVIVYTGRLNGYRVEYSPIRGENVVRWTVTSHWADFTRRRGRRTNTESQQAHYASDLGLEFAPLSIEKIDWGNSA